MQYLFSKQFFTAILLFFITANATAQTIIKGRLISEKGEPVAFASVVVKGTHTGVQTTISGDFRLSVTQKLPLTVVFSAVGYQPTEKIITKKYFKDTIVNITVTITASTAKLDEVVVIGYGVSSKKSFAASSPVSAGDFASTTYRSASAGYSATYDALEGKASGIKVGPAKPLTKGEAIPDDKLKETDTRKKKEIGSEVNNSATRTSLLTAGEVNDFKKWKMWEDYSAADFKVHSQKWGLYATQRYSVQLQNNDYKAVTGETVYLINTSNNDTLWTAVSDNTGKAELWSGFTNATTENNLVIAVAKEKKQFTAVPFEQGINRIIINRSCTVSSKVEIAFLVDATSSMGDEINYLKVELTDILTKIAEKDTTLDLHTGAVFYRDHYDSYVTKVQPFTTGVTTTVGFIQQQTADGGGDYPEALKEGLQDALEKLSWSADARTRIIFLLMDAPPHDDAKAEMETLISKASAMGIRIVPVACSGTDKATEFIMRSIALATNGTYLFLTDDSGIGNSHIKPTTDEFKVEFLNDLLVRVIEQMCYVNTCSVKTTTVEPTTVYHNTEKVKVYPNPTTGPVTLETNKELKEIFVADFTGKILMRTNVKGSKGKYHIDLSAFPSATYFIRYTTNDNTTGAEKVVLLR